MKEQNSRDYQHKIGRLVKQIFSVRSYCLEKSILCCQLTNRKPDSGSRDNIDQSQAEVEGQGQVQTRYLLFV